MVQRFLQSFVDDLRARLADLDRAAQENVLSGKGGPFAAQVMLYATTEPDGLHRLVHTFPHTTNEVLNTGIASAHAEAQSLSSANIAQLMAHLRTLCAQGETPMVVFLSSAQPCPACQIKIEILARYLVQETLIAPGRFILLFGATYDDTRRVSGFNDYTYALDLLAFAQGGGFVRHTNAAQNTLPASVRTAFDEDKNLGALLVLNHRLLGFGYDECDNANLFRSASCVALHDASHKLKNEGHATPWNLHGAQLYTRHDEIDPLTYAECQWAAVTNVISLPAQHAQNSNATTPRPYILPKESYASGYNTAHSLLHVVRDAAFANLAQSTWAARPDKVVYNGAKAPHALTKEEIAAFDRLFRPTTLPK